MARKSFQLIHRERWRLFFDDLSRAHRGCLTTIEVQTQWVGAEMVAIEQPLAHIRFDRIYTSQINIRLGAGIEHTVAAPVAVRVAPYLGGGGQVVEIDGMGAPLTRLYLSLAARGGAERAVGG